MSNIKVQCIDQAIGFLNTPVISSGNVNYDTITFDFCSKWNGFTKTAIFYRTKDEVYYQILDESNTCNIPNEVLGEKGVIYIGVFGSSGDTTITSQVLKYRIDEGAITEDLRPTDPTPDIYDQIISLCSQIRKEQTDFITAWEKTIQDTRDEMIAEVEKIIENEGVGDAETLGGFTPVEVGASGARNLIPYPYVDTTKTTNGLTFTDNGDGTITVNGTATATTYFSYRTRTEPKPIGLKNGYYTLSGCPIGGSTTTYGVQFGRDLNGTWGQYGRDYGDGLTILVTDEPTKIQIQIVIFSGATVENLVFKPMLEVGKVVHDFVPYHFGGAVHAESADKATDADTVDGKHASAFMANSLGACTDADLLTWLKNQTTGGYFTVNPTVTTSGCPANGAWYYGILGVGVGTHSVILFRSYHSGVGFKDEMYFNSTSSGTWREWKKLANADETADGTNLLVNPDFAINTSGKTEYTAIGYTVDKWQNNKLSSVATNGKVEVLTNGVKLIGGGTRLDLYFRQYIDNGAKLTGKTVTVSVMLEELSGSFYIGQYGGSNSKLISSNGVSSYTFTWLENSVNAIHLYNNTGSDSCIVRWIKLEIGKQATPFVPPNPEVEKLKCGGYTPIVPTNVDPGVGASVTYADGTVIFVYEEE